MKRRTALKSIGLAGLGLCVPGQLLKMLDLKDPAVLCLVKPENIASETITFRRYVPLEADPSCIAEGIAPERYNVKVTWVDEPMPSVKDCGWYKCG